jgi:hypothetical protein
MLGTPTQTIKKTCLNYTKRMLLTLAVLVMLGVGVAAECERQSFHYRTIIYGGRQFDTFVSCGSSGGNFAYTCAEGGLCYLNTSIDANAECGCSDSIMR